MRRVSAGLQSGSYGSMGWPRSAGLCVGCKKKKAHTRPACFDPSLYGVRPPGELAGYWRRGAGSLLVAACTGDRADHPSRG